MDASIEARMAALLAEAVPAARLVWARPLTGGISATMTAVEFVLPDGASRRWVIRQVPDHNPDFALPLSAEHRLLTVLHALGLPIAAPRHLAAGAANDLGWYAVDLVEGAPRYSATDWASTVRVMAEQLAAIHRIDADLEDFRALPRRADFVGARLGRPPAQPDPSVREELVREVLGAHWPPSSPTQNCLLHGDFWPGNLLWQGTRIVAVIDWENACLGDPVADVAIARLDVLWTYGEQAMTAFTDDYLALNPVSVADLPRWDLVAALRPAGAISLWSADWPRLGRPDITPATMRTAHRWYVDRALAALGVPPRPVS